MLNNGQIGWSYPSLILFNGNGDTIAWQGAEYFALANDQVFSLPIIPGAVIPSDPFYATVELWTGFNDSLRCTFFPEPSLCPQAPCTIVHPFATYSGDTAGLELEWTVTETTTNEVLTGALSIPQGISYAQTDVCLPPGHYTLTMFNPWISGDGLYFNMKSSAWNSSETPYVEMADSVPSMFTLFEACIDDDNAVAQLASEEIVLSVVAGRIHLQLPMGDHMSVVELLDGTGRVLHRITGVQNQLELDITGFAPGVFVLAVTNNKNERWSRALAWTR